MNPLQTADNIINKESNNKPVAEQSVATNSAKTENIKKEPVLVSQDNTEGTSSRTEVFIPENRLKLKPEQSYKKETKASRLGKSTGRWTQQEHLLFIEGLKIYGKNWKKVESYIGTRTGTQIRSHAQKFFNRIKKEHKTEDPSKYVIDNMGDDDVRRIILEHLGDDANNIPEEKDSSSDTPEVLFSITKDKSNKRKKDDQDDTPTSMGASRSAFKSFKRSENDVIAAPEDSKIPTILKKPICLNPTKPSFSPSNLTLNQVSTTLNNIQQAAAPSQPLMNQLEINQILLRALLAQTSTQLGNGLGNSTLDGTTLTYLLAILNGNNSIH